MAKTYGKLPSEVAANATTYDLMVTDLLAAWEAQCLEEAKTGIKKVDISTEEMQSMLNKVKNG